jgi:protein gp37
MGENSKIEWTDHTFNPWIGCVNVSPGCDHCYAEALSKRTGLAQWGKDTERHRTSTNYWKQPLKWELAASRMGARARVFCASLADVMEDRRDLDAVRSDLRALIESTPSLDWLLLTKRPQNFARLLPCAWLKNPQPNVWVMTTVESPEYFWRIAELTSVPAVVHGLSIEPLLAPMPTLQEHLVGISWVIVGGESGPKARPMEAAWVRSIRDACQLTGTAFHFKQWGEYSQNLVRIGKKSAGRLLDGREWNELPERCHEDQFAET